MESQLTKRGSGRELAIVLHGPHGSPEKMQGFRRRLRSDPRISTSLPLFCLMGGFFGLLRTTSVEQIVRDVIEEIDKALAGRERRVEVPMSVSFWLVTVVGP
jgi:hypothetical protein